MRHQLRLQRDDLALRKQLRLVRPLHRTTALLLFFRKQVQRLLQEFPRQGLREFGTLRCGGLIGLCA